MSWVLSWMWLMGFFIPHRRRAWYAREKNVVFIVSLLYVFSWRWIWILKMDIDRDFESDYERVLSSFHVFSPSFFTSLSILAKKKQSDCFLCFFFTSFFLFLSPSRSSFHVDLRALYMNRCWLVCYLIKLIVRSFHSCFLSCIITTIVLSVMYTHKRKTKERK